VTETSARPRVIRARRYVSAPPGTYPAPVPAVPETEGAAAPAAEVPASPADEPAVPTAAAAPVPGPAAAEAAPRVPEPDPGEEAGLARSPGWGGVLLGTLVGAVVGLSLGMILVAFFGGCEPSLAWTDPLAVWRTVTDPVIRFSGILVATGCALLGAALGGRRPAPPPED